MNLPPAISNYGHHFLEPSSKITQLCEKLKGFLRTLLQATPTPWWLPDTESFKKRNELQKEKLETFFFSFFYQIIILWEGLLHFSKPLHFHQPCCLEIKNTAKEEETTLEMMPKLERGQTSGVRSFVFGVDNQIRHFHCYLETHFIMKLH